MSFFSRLSNLVSGFSNGILDRFEENNPQIKDAQRKQEIAKQPVARRHVDDAARRFCRTPELVVDSLGHGPAFGQFFSRNGGVRGADGPRHLVKRAVAHEVAHVGCAQATGHDWGHAHRQLLCFTPSLRRRGACSAACTALQQLGSLG